MFRPLLSSILLLGLLCLSLSGVWSSPLPEKALDDAASYLPTNALELAEMPPLPEGGREKRSFKQGCLFEMCDPEDPTIN